jgi:MoxR-like ATPase
MFHVLVDYPDEDDELAIVKRTTTDVEATITPTLDADQISELTKIVRKVPIADHIARYAIKLARLTRRQVAEAPEFIKEYVMWGAGPRASQYLVLGAKARAVLRGRYYVSQEDIRAVALPVLRHRIKTNFNADAEGVSADDVITKLIDFVPQIVDDTEDDAARGNREKVADVFRSPDAG